MCPQKSTCAPNRQNIADFRVMCPTRKSICAPNRRNIADFRVMCPRLFWYVHTFANCVSPLQIRAYVYPFSHIHTHQLYVNICYFPDTSRQSQLWNSQPAGSDERDSKTILSYFLQKANDYYSGTETWFLHGKFIVHNVFVLCAPPNVLCAPPPPL